MKQYLLSILDDLGLVWKYAINGFIGGLIWSMYKKSRFWEAFRQIIIGGIVSGYFTPVIVIQTKMDLSLIGFTSFIIGMLGMVIVDTAYKYTIGNYQKWREALKILTGGASKNKENNQ